MRRDFIANAAHELRTPLTNLQGYLEALRDGVIVADRATYESLREEAERLVRLSRSLDALAEGDAGPARRVRSSSIWRSAVRSALELRAAGDRAGRAGARRSTSRTPAGAGRPRSARPGPGQPALERGPLHAAPAATVDVRAERRPGGPARRRSATPARGSRRTT